MQEVVGATLLEHDGAEIRPNRGVHDHLVSDRKLQVAWVEVGDPSMLRDGTPITCFARVVVVMEAPPPPVSTQIQHWGVP